MCASNQGHSIYLSIFAICERGTQGWYDNKYRPLFISYGFFCRLAQICSIRWNAFPKYENGCHSVCSFTIGSICLCWVMFLSQKNNKIKNRKTKEGVIVWFLSLLVSKCLCQTSELPHVSCDLAGTRLVSVHMSGALILLSKRLRCGAAVIFNFMLKEWSPRNRICLFPRIRKCILTKNCASGSVTTCESAQQKWKQPRTFSNEHINKYLYKQDRLNRQCLFAICFILLKHPGPAV